MPSSTTSSERRASTWIAAALLAATAIGGYEAMLRRDGVQPSVSDDKELWSAVREQAVGADRFTLALIGASRIQLAFCFDEARRVAPRLRPLQLAVDGTNAFATFRDLAEDDSFRGTALFSLLPGALAPRVWEDQTPWIRRRAAGWTWNDDWNRRLRSQLQENLAVFAPEADATRVLVRLVRGKSIADQPMVMGADRSRRADYARLPREVYAADRLRRDRAGLESSPKGDDYDAWLRAVDETGRLARKLQARGGRAVIFHDLLTGEYRRTYEAAFPRAIYWDPIVARVGAVCVHPLDVPELASVDCPDGSHVDRRDAPAFTRGLLLELKRRGVIDD